MMGLVEKTIDFLNLLGRDASGPLFSRMCGREPGEAKNILVVMLAGIGNMVLFLPVLKTLRNKYQSSKITLLVAPRGTKDLFLNSSLVDEILVYERRREKEQGYREDMVRKLREKGFDLGISQFSSLWSAKFLADVQVRYRVSFMYPLLEKKRKVWVPFLLHDAPRYEDEEHEVIHNVKLVRRISREKVLDISLDVTEKERAWAEEEIESFKGREGGSTFIGIHNGAFKDMPQKKWKNEFFGEVGNIIREKHGAVPVIFGGETEVADAEEIAEISGGIPVAGKYTIRETAALIQKCSLFISTDSGLMHIAASVGTPVIGIFGPTDPKKSAPFANEEVARVVMKGVDCQPCYRPYTGKILCGNPVCMTDFSPDEFMRWAGEFVCGILGQP